MPRLSRKRNQQRSQRRQQRSQGRQQRSQRRQQRSQGRQQRSQRRQRGGKSPHLKTPHCKKAVNDLSFNKKLEKGPQIGHTFGEPIKVKGMEVDRPPIFNRNDLQAASEAKFKKKKGNCHVYLRSNKYMDMGPNGQGCSIDLASVQGKPGFFNQLKSYSLVNPKAKMDKRFRKNLDRICKME